ncbi:MAG: 4-hydroxy-tetrahydrodipicolinate reductase, partial [Verrucomicrobia bacterium]
MSLKIAIIGARGRMGQANLAAAREAGATVVAALDQGDALSHGIGAADVVIDFSFHAATAEVIALCTEHQKALVVGTTGHPAEAKRHLLASAARIPCVWSGNYSVGVNLLFALTRRAASVLESDYDAEVIEMHHRFKKDAPSGTADRLLEIILEERKLASSALRHGRQGITGERTSTEVGIHALRGGDVVGDHTVMFAALG